MLKHARIAWVAAAFFLGCSERAPEAPHPRIVAFSPALAEMVFDLGLGDHVVGVTTHTSLPAGQGRPIVGDALNVNVEAILAVEPDLVLTQVDAKKFGALRRLRPQVRVEALTIETLDDIGSALRRIGRVAGRPEAGRAAADRLAETLAAVRKRVAGRPRPRVLFVMGYERPYVAAGGTFVGDLIDVAGGVNAGADTPGTQRWRAANAEGVVAARPDVLICHVGPGAEAAAVAAWGKWADMPAVKAGRVFAVTDRHWIVPSGRVARLAGRLADRIHPDTRAGGAAP